MLLKCCVCISSETTERLVLYMETRTCGLGDLHVFEFSIIRRTSLTNNDIKNTFYQIVMIIYLALVMNSNVHMVRRQIKRQL